MRTSGAHLFADDCRALKPVRARALLPGEQQCAVAVVCDAALPALWVVVSNHQQIAPLLDVHKVRNCAAQPLRSATPDDRPTTVAPPQAERKQQAVTSRHGRTSRADGYTVQHYAQAHAPTLGTLPRPVPMAPEDSGTA